jgi:hypothetical protein
MSKPVTIDTLAAAPKLMGIREYSRHRGCSHPAVIKAIKDGRLASALRTDARGKQVIDQAAADLEWSLTTDPAQQREKDEQRKADPKPTPTEKQLLIDGSVEDVVPPKDDSDQLASRARLTFSVQRSRGAAAKAEMLELQVQERRGDLINRMRVQDEAFRQATKLREAIMRVAVSEKHKLAAIKDPEKIQARLEAALRTALRSLTNGPSTQR